MNPNTYSLRSILQSDLDPALCKLMLHQIKSPLLQHSFQLTTDDQINGGEFSNPYNQQFSQIYQRQHQYNRSISINNQKQRNGVNKNYRKKSKKLDSLSMAMSQYQLSRRQFIPPQRDYQQNEHYKMKINTTDEYIDNQYRNYIKNRYQQPQNNKTNELNSFHQESIIPQLQQKQINLFLNQIVSPLQCNTQLISPSRQNFNNVLQQTISQRYSKKSSDQEGKIGLAIAQWCGQVMNTQNAHQNQIYFDKDPNYVRKKIFDKNRQKPKGQISVSSSIRPKNYYVTFKEAIKKLYQIQQQQVGGFLQLIYRILSLLNKASPHKINLTKNQATINKIILKDNPVNHQTRQTISNKDRIISRLRVNKVSQIFQKLVTKQPSSHKLQSNSFQINRVQVDMSKTLQYYSEIEDLIEDYVSRPDTVTNLHKIYNLLYDHQIKTLAFNSHQQVIPPNREKNDLTKTIKLEKDKQSSLNLYSLKDKLNNFFLSLKIDPQHYKNLHQLNYIWSQVNKNGSYSPTSKKAYITNKQKFILQLCRNDVIIHGQVKGINQLQIEKKFIQMGFQRNKQ